MKKSVTIRNVDIKKTPINSYLERDFVWSENVPIELRDDIDLSELNDPLELYGKWVDVEKNVEGVKMWVEIRLSINADDYFLIGDIYLNTQNNHRFFYLGENNLLCNEVVGNDFIETILSDYTQCGEIDLILFSRSFPS